MRGCSRLCCGDTTGFRPCRSCHHTVRNWHRSNGSGGWRERQHADQHKLLDSLQVGDQGLDGETEGIAGSGDGHHPQSRTDQVEERKARQRDPARSQNHRPGDTQAVKESDRDNRQSVVAREDRVDTRFALCQSGEALDQGRTFPAPEQKCQLVTQCTARDGDQDYDGPVEQAAMGGKSGGDQNGFPFEQRADENGEIAPRCDKVADHPVRRCR